MELSTSMDIVLSNFQGLSRPGQAWTDLLYLTRAHWLIKFSDMEYDQFYYTVPKVLIGNQHVSLPGEEVKEVGYKDKMKDLVTYFMFLHHALKYNYII